MHPILFKIGPVIIYTYGVMVSLAFAVCAFLIWYNAPLVRIPRGKVLDLVIVILISGIVGARCLHVISNFDYYRSYPLDIIMLFKGGLAFHGGLIFSFIGGIVFLKMNSIPICPTADLVAPYAALGQAIGRIGCFLNGCCFGKTSELNYFGVTFPGETVYRHPAQVYSFIALLLIYLILRFMLQRNILKNNLILIYFMLHSSQRFFLDFLRGDILRVSFGFTLSQIISLVIFFIACGIFIWRRLGFNAKI